MRDSFAAATAVLVATALLCGAVAPVVGAQPETAASTTDGPTADQTDDACGFPVELTDATGTTVALDERPERITTVNPSAAQTLWELGVDDRVVGVSQFAFYLDGAANRTNVSASFGASVERVVDTEPDLVLAPNSSAGDVEALREQGLTVYHFPAAASVDDIAAKTETTGRLVGACGAAAETNAEMYNAVAAAESRTEGVDRPTALYPLGDGYVAANGTFIDAIMTAGGTDNAAADHEGYPQLSAEVILETNPDLLLVTDPEAAVLDEEPYASTTAGVERNYVVMDRSYLNQPAPRSVIESTETLADAVVTLDDAEADAGPTADTDARAPGFGVVAAALALLAAGLLARRD